MDSIYNEAYQAWLQCGRNTATAARLLNIPRTTARDRIHRAQEILGYQEPIITFWDIETSHIISAHYGIYDVNIHTDNILLDWRIVCGAWKFKGEKKQSVSLLDDMKRFNKNCFDIRKLNIDDYHVVKTLHDILNQTDILVHHNGDKFDLKKFNARALQHKLPPINKLKTVDTLKVARQKFGITSNSLDYLAKYLGLTPKIHNERGLAFDVTMCNPEAIKKYVKYNEGDVTTLEEVYYALLPYMTNHPNLNLYTNSKCCPNCGSHAIIENGEEYSRVRSVRSYRCNSCGAVFNDGKTVKKAMYR